MVDPDEQAIVRCETTTGSVTMKMVRVWSPNGYDRAVELFERHFYDESHFYRVVPKFLVQFGISYSDDRELQKFAKTPIKDDPPLGMKFHKGTISYAGSGDNSRTSQLFISYGSIKSLGTQKWETPIGEVIEGMEHVDNFYSYGDMPPWGQGPKQGLVHTGPQYIEDNFPKSDKFLHCKVERLTGEQIKKGGSTLLKSDGKTDEEEFHRAREAGLHDDAPQYKANERDQPLLPASLDNVTTYIAVSVLAFMAFTLLALRRRTKVASKAN